MANIAIIDYCNLRCPYCFASKYFEEADNSQVITQEQLDRILDFLGRSTCDRVGIIGGEPTLHPKFPEILRTIQEFCKAHNCGTSIFTNGILIGNYAKLFDERTGCLINLNHPEVVGERNWKSIMNSLSRLSICSSMDNVNLGINLYHTMKDYDYIFNLALKYNKDHIRVSYVAPTCQFSNVDKDSYYEEARSIFLPFVEKAISYGIRIRLDCNHIPRCFFSDLELAMIDSIVEGFHDYCEPVIDITPDFKCTSCFGAYKLYDLEGFQNIREVERYLRYKRMYPLSEANNSGKCATCPKHENLSCQGGCLAFVSK